MPTMNDYLKYAETAFAAYANNLVSGQGNATKYENFAGMSPAQAQQFDATWKVLAQQDLSDGFSAVLFQQVDAQGNPIGEKVLALRGTEASHWGIDYLTDVVNIALLGTSVGMPQYNSLESFYQALVTQGKLGAAESITVTGHSLGGFLSQAFTAKHDSVVSAAYTYNSPGFSAATGVLSGIGTELLEFFSITDASIPSSKIFNVRATDGTSLTSGLGQMIGYVQGGAIESSSDPVHNHSITTLTDALALYAAYAKLDPTASVTTITNLIKASSNLNVNTLETALDNVPELIFGATTPGTLSEGRESYYTNLKQLTDWLNARSSTATALKLDALTSYGGTAIAPNAQANTPDGLAYRYALANLNPFAVTGDASLYASHNAAGELNRHDPATGTGNLSDLYLQDRAAMLSWKLKFNVGAEDSDDDRLGIFNRGDKPYSEEWDSFSISGDWDFIDKASGITLAIDGVDLTTTINHQIVFGSAASETLVGDSLIDRLYGGAGSDTLLGDSGSELIYGGAANDLEWRLAA